MRHSAIGALKRGKAVLGAALGLVVIVSACNEAAVRTQQEKDVRIQNYKTYRWVSQEDSRYLSLRDPNTDQPVQNYVNIRQRPQTEQRVREVVEKDLQQYGYTPQFEGLPDFFITFYSPTRAKGWISSWSGTTLAFQNAPLVMFPNFDMHRALEFRPGMAYVVIYDSKTKRPAWTGTILNAISPEGDVNAPVVTAQIGDLIQKFKAAA
jgi:hypothetical protein